MIGELFNTLLTAPLANGLVLSYTILFSNMGLAIIGFTTFLRFLLHPLTKKGVESMTKMREHQGELQKLRERHKDDRKKQMQAQADFYREKGINPSAGCVPQIVQLVVLIAFFRVFTTVLVGDIGELATRFNEFLYEPLRFGADTIINTKFLYLDVTSPDVFEFATLPFPLPGPVLVLAAITQLISAKISMPYIEEEKKLAKKTKTPTDDFAANFQSSMIYTFPLMTLLIGVGFPSGLALYWLTFSLWQTLQQYRSFGAGGLTPWMKRLGLVQLATNGNRKTSSGKN